MTAARFSTYDQVGIKEDVSDVISNIDPTATPFATAIRTGKKAISKVVEWQEDSLSAVAENAQIDGDDAPAADQKATEMRTNYTQILSKTAKVTGSAEAVHTHGRKSEMALQLAKKGKEIKLDLEHVLVGLDTTKQAGNDSTIPRKMSSVFPQIDASMKGNAGTADLTEAMVRTRLQAAYDAGANTSTLMIKPTDADHVAAFATSRDVGNSEKVVNSVQVYVTPWGTLRVVLNRLLKADTALIFDPEMWELRWLRNWFTQPLAVTGDSMAKQIIGEVTLCHKNAKATAAITNLST